MTTAAAIVNKLKYGMTNRLDFTSQLKQMLEQHQLGRALFSHHQPVIVVFESHPDGDFVLKAFEPLRDTSIQYLEDTPWARRVQLSPPEEPRAMYYVNKVRDNAPPQVIFVESFKLPRGAHTPDYFLQRQLQFGPDLHRRIKSLVLVG